jgi:hypothetical protein
MRRLSASWFLIGQGVFVPLVLLTGFLASCSTSGQVPASRPSAQTWWQSGTAYLALQDTQGPVVETLLSEGITHESLDERRFAPRDVASPFGSFGQVDFSGSRLRTLALSYGAMWQGTPLTLPQMQESSVVCGPMPPPRGQWSLVCLSRSTGEVLDILPLPGELSAAPLFHNGSWILATTKGFLFRTMGLSERGTPVLGGDNTSFWGGRSRDRMGHLRSLYRELSSKDQSASMAATGASLEFMQSGWAWFHWSSTPFVTPLMVQGSRVLGLTANQFVYAVELESGKIAWAQRVGSTEDLQLESRALALTGQSIVAGNAEGVLTFLNSGSGKVEFQIEVPRKTGERFVGIVAQPLVAGQRVVASNGSSTTVMINERSRKIEWQVQHGSVASPKRWGESVFVGTVDGRLLKVDLNNGAIAADRLLRRGQPIASLAVLDGGQHLLAAMNEGEVLVLRTTDLVPVQTFQSLGEIRGEWLGHEDKLGSCLSTRSGQLRCFALASAAP